MYKKDAKRTFESLGDDWAAATSGQWTATQIAALYKGDFLFDIKLVDKVGVGSVEIHGVAEKLG